MLISKLLRILWSFTSLFCYSCNIAKASWQSALHTRQHSHPRSIPNHVLSCCLASRPRKDFVTLKQCTCVALYPQIVLPVGVLVFVGLKWYHRSRRRRRQREEKHIVRQGSRQDIRDLNV